MDCDVDKHTGHNIMTDTRKLVISYQVDDAPIVIVVMEVVVVVARQQSAVSGLHWKEFQNSPAVSAAWDHH